MQEVPRTLKILTVYGLVFVALFLSLQWWQAEQRKARVVSQGGVKQVSLPRDRSGHYFWQGRINGVEAEFMVDTGATTTSVPKSLADTLGLKEDGSALFNTANGSVRAGLVRVTLELEGGLKIEQQRIAIMPQMDDDVGLLGMDVLGKLQLQQEGKELKARLP